MKHLLAAAAAAPLLIACASAGAQTASSQAGEEVRVLVVNGERVVISEQGDAASAIEEALARSGDSRRVILEFQGEPSSGWSAESREAFAQAMAEMAEAFGEDFRGDFDFDFDFDFDGEHFSWSDAEGEEIEIIMRRIEREAERHAADVEREAERMARQAERMAVRVQRQAARAEVQGLRAGVEGVQEGLEGIDQTLERGWYYQWNDGERERVDLTEDKRTELTETRAELVETLESLRASLARAEARHGGERREVRIVRRDGEARAWVDGEEVTGSELDRLLEGAPDAPQPPETPGENN